MIKYKCKGVILDNILRELIQLNNQVSQRLYPHKHATGNKQLTTKTYVDKIPKSDVSTLYAVLDIEFLNNNFEMKQIGIIYFDNNYQQIGKFECSIIEDDTTKIVVAHLNKYLPIVKSLFLWGGVNDINCLNSIGIELDNLTIVDASNYFKFKTYRTSLKHVHQLIFGEDSQGYHNALIDAKFTLDIIEYYDLINPNSCEKIANYNQISLGVIEQLNFETEKNVKKANKVPAEQFLKLKEICKNIDLLPKEKSLDDFRRITLSNAQANYTKQELSNLGLKNCIFSNGLLNDKAKRPTNYMLAYNKSKKAWILYIHKHLINSDK